MLRTETNTPETEADIRREAMDETGLDLDRDDIQTDFEHGQWWVTQLSTGAQWSVVDVLTRAGEEVFGFEQVSEGEDA
jgi:hypothetical protein